MPLIPMTVIGGFLGAGKTTLLNHLIRSPMSNRMAVLVNDFGDLAIDEDLIAAHGGDTIALANGCICCSIGNDLIATLLGLLTSETPPERIVIEASGVADPRPIADIADFHKGLQRDGTIVLVDAERLLDLSCDVRLCDTVERQVAAADIVIINKCDLVDEAKLTEVQGWLGQQAKLAIVLTAVDAHLPVELLLGVSSEEKQDQGSHERKVHAHPFHSVSVRFDAPVEIKTFKACVEALPASVLRGKGLIRGAGVHNNLWLFQMVGPCAQYVAVDHDVPPQREGTILFIGTEDMPVQTWFNSHFGLS